MATVRVENRTRVRAALGPLREYARRALESTREWRDAELSIILVGDRRIQALNTKWRGKDRPTDVISFPMGGDRAPGEPLLIGDIVIGARQALADAREEGVPLNEKLRELTLHSILHLMGHDHENPARARAMESKRRSLTKAMGRHS